MYSNNYFILNDSCQLVEGARRGAIYSLESNKVYSINENAKFFLKSLQKGKLVYEVLTEYDNLNDEYIKFLKQLEKMKLGHFSECWNKASGKEINTKPKMPLNFMWIELTSRCNNNCIHCYSESSPEIYNDTFNLEDWKLIISQGADWGCQSIQLTGGEPLLFKNLKELIIYTIEKKYNFIEVFTNATLIDEDWVNFFSTYKINIATSIFSDKSETHDRITRNRGSYEKTVNAIRHLLNKNVNVRVASIIMNENENDIETLIEFLLKLNVNFRKPDIVRPTGRGSDKKLLPQKYNRDQNTRFYHTNNKLYSHNKYWNPCLAGKISVDNKGNINPCIFLRTESIGNIRNSRLKEIIESPILQNYWNTTLDDIDECNECEYRYACFDCRPLAQADDIKKSWLSKPSWCNYKPKMKHSHKKEPQKKFEIIDVTCNNNDYKNDKIQRTGWDCHPRCTPQSEPGGPGCYPSCNPKCSPDTCSPNCDPSCRVQCSPDYCSPSCKPSCDPLN